MPNNRRVAVHIGTTGYSNKNGSNGEKMEVVRLHAVTFGGPKEEKAEVFEQVFMPSCPIMKSATDEHGYTKVSLKKLDAPVFSKELGAKFVKFIGDSKAYGHASYTTHIANNALKEVGFEKEQLIPKMTYTFQLLKEIDPEICKKLDPRGQPTLDMIIESQRYKIANLDGAYKVAAVVMKLEDEITAKNKALAKNDAKDQKAAASALISMSMFGKKPEKTLKNAILKHAAMEKLNGTTQASLRRI